LSEEKIPQDRPGRSSLFGGKRLGFSLGYALLGVLLLFAFRSATDEGPRTVSYSSLKQQLRDRQIAEIWVGEQEVLARRGKPALPTADGAATASGASQGGEGAKGAFALFGGGGPRPDLRALRVPGDEELPKLVEGSGAVAWGHLEEPPVLLRLFSWMLPIGVMILFWVWMMRRMGGGHGVMAFGKSKYKLHGENDVITRFVDVAGVDEAKTELVEVVDYLKNPGRYGKLGARIPKGVLLVGPPGTGKTLLARAVAGEAHVPFFTLSGADFVELFVGVGASRVRDLFEQAQKNAPCIVFIDELDALGKARGGPGGMGGNDEREQTLNQLLVQMDGFDPATGVVILAATNRPEFLDAALLRAGRFDRQVLVDRPDRAGRQAILEVHAAKVQLAPDVDLDQVAARTPGFVGADLANLLNEAALLAARRDAEQVSSADLELAIDRIVAGLEKKNRLINPHEKRVVAYHEAGHAVVSSCVQGADPVQKVSIVPRGLGALGITWHAPTEDRYLMTVSELQGKIAVLLGGRAAELVFFGEASTGAANDLARATEAARAMVVEYGMSELLGPVRLRPERRAFLPGMEGYERGEYGDRVADQIDTEVRRLVDEALERARRLLLERRDRVERLAELLLEQETVSGDEVRRLVCDEAAPRAAESSPATSPLAG